MGNNESTMSIVKNAAYCFHCKQEIESRAPDDMVMCSGAHMAVDGGLTTLKRVFFKDRVRWEDRSQINKGEKKIKKEGATLEWNKPGIRRN